MNKIVHHNKLITGKIIMVTLLLVCAHYLNAQVLSDKNATRQTKMAYKNLFALSKKNILFGHQDDLAYGVNWKYVDGKSDIKDIVNDYPAVYGWDLARIEHGAEKNIDGVPFSKMRTYIQEGYDRGGMITLSWHFDNPLTAKDAWDTTHGAVAACLPGGEKNALFISWLDKAAVFIKSLKGKHGESIPVLFRPFHECTGNWFWWCKNTNDVKEFTQLWRFTIDYLRNKKQLHNLIIVYNTAGFANERDFLERYPGNDVVDMVSFDMYQFEGQSRQGFIDTMRYEIKHLINAAKKKNKIAAIAETGFEAIPDSLWWTETLLPMIKGYSLAYVLVWRNAGYMESMKKMHYYAPYKGQASEEDFKKMYQSGKIIFEKQLSKKNIYQ